MGIINDEMPDWMTKCSEFNIPIIETSSNLSTTISPYSTNDDLPDCNFNELSCKYLSLLYKQGILDMVSLSLPLPTHISRLRRNVPNLCTFSFQIPYNTIEEAVDDVHKGHLWGYIHFGNNYSQHMIDRLATKQFAFEETINGSIINVRMDMSRKYTIKILLHSQHTSYYENHKKFLIKIIEYLGSVIIIKNIFEGLQSYVQQLIDSCELGAKQAEIPLYVSKSHIIQHKLHNCLKQY